MKICMYIVQVVCNIIIIIVIIAMYMYNSYLLLSINLLASFSISSAPEVAHRNNIISPVPVNYVGHVHYISTTCTHVASK